VLFRVSADGCLFMKLEFETVRDRVSGAMMNTMFDTVSLVAKVLTAARNAEKSLKRATSLSLLPALTDATAQLNALVFPGFVSATGTARLASLPRYLSGIIHRAEKLADNPNRDRVWMNETQTATSLFEAAGGTIPLEPFAPPHLVKARWMLEELRLSLFAQNIGAAETVSLQRIRKVLAG
jgi:ATP-dependent helicase HrpA